MAETVLRDLARAASGRWACTFVGVRHARGRVGIGETSVVVSVVCGHRAEAFEACRFLIDALKVQAPIWKREVWADGSTWVEGTPAGADA